MRYPPVSECYWPLEVEQRVTYPIETVMAGLPGLEQTRSLSRYGLSHVPVIFKGGTDIYFARQLVNQRVQEARQNLPEGMTPTRGPISTGLGEIYLWTVESEPGAKKADAAVHACRPGGDTGNGENRALSALGTMGRCGASQIRLYPN